MNYILHQGDALEQLRQMESESIDSCVTDPPYEIGFMGKSWDSTGIAYSVKLWQEVLRVLKPGGYLLSFGGTRTYHRMACAIEDAGFEIRDQIQWIYGSGFPKSMDISKAIDKAAGAEREVVGKGKSGAQVSMSRIRVEQGYRKNLTNAKTEFDITIPATPEAQRWGGWGTALKPANEPIVVARKPLSEKTVAENVLKWGTGGINIDGCRIGTTEELRGGAGGLLSNVRDNKPYPKENGYQQSSQGRFPANVIFDEEAGRLLDEQSGVLKSGAKHGIYNGWGTGRSIYGESKEYRQDCEADSGGASRFFYCAKASKKERGEDNNHPTVKPITLMRYLCRLVTPPTGTVLDPFAGSGTTLIAAISEDFNAVGIELNPEYCKLIERRMAGLDGNLFEEGG